MESAKSVIVCLVLVHLLRKIDVKQQFTCQLWSSVLQAIETSETSVPDMLCLCGRIYKDKFVESSCKDKTSLQHAIDW